MSSDYVEVIDLDFERVKYEAWFDEQVKKMKEDNEIKELDSIELEVRILNIDELFNLLELDQNIFEDLEEVLFDLDNSQVNTKQAIEQIQDIIKSRMCLIDNIDKPYSEINPESDEENSDREGSVCI